MAPLQVVLAEAAENLYPARMQMALSLGWHIVFSCLGVAFPAMVLFAEWRAHRTGDAALHELAHTWAKAMGVLFAAGAVSGTLLTFEMGILWPGLMNTYGEVFGFPFVLEGFSFFIEAIFVGIYLFGWNRLSPRAHMLAPCPMILAGMAGTFFVVAANAWMNNPVGFDVAPDGTLTNVDPIARHVRPVDAPAGRPHVDRGLHGDRLRHRVGLRGRHAARAAATATTARDADPADRRGGLRADPDRRRRLDRQHRRGAAADQARRDGGAVPRRRPSAPLSLGGIYYDDELHYALEIPYGLSLLIHHDPDGVVPGLEEIPEEDRPPVNVVHLAYNTMVGAGSALLRARARVRLRLVEAAVLDREPLVPAAPSRSPGSPRGGAGDAAGSPPRSAASRGSSTATCAPRTP